MSEVGQLITPYSVAPPGGRGVLDFLNDFMSEKQRREMLDEQAGVQRSTRNELNMQNNYAPGVDPFKMLDFSGQEQELAAKTQRQVHEGTLFDNGQQDRMTQQSYIENLLGGLREQPGYANDPLLGSVLGAGNAPAAVDHFMGIAGNDRQQDGAYQRAMLGQRGQASSAMQLAQYKAQLEAAQRQQTMEMFMNAVNTGDRLPLQALTGMKAAESGDAETMGALFTQGRDDRAYNLSEAQKAAKAAEDAKAAIEFKQQMDEQKKNAPQQQENYNNVIQNANDPSRGIYFHGAGPQANGVTPEFDSVKTERQKELEQTRAIKQTMKSGGQAALDVIMKLLEGAGNVKG